MRKYNSMLLISFILCIFANSIFAQSKDTGAVNTYRLHIKENLLEKEERYIGQVLGIDSNIVKFSILRNTEIREFPTSSIIRIDLKTGQRNYAKRGFFIGLAAGSIYGFIAGAYVSSQVGVEIIALPTLAAGLAGGLIGSMIGENMKRDRWEGISFEQFRKDFRPPGRYYQILRFQFPLRK
ncbi:hypothetical protein ACFL6O_01435 [candidate division KSB1 bacterium]